MLTTRRFFKLSSSDFALGFKGTLVLATFVPLAITAIVAALLVAAAAVFLFVTSFIATLIATAFFTAALAALSLRVGVEGFVVFSDFFTFAAFVVTEEIEEGAGDVGRCVAGVE